jgi:hypothetical protein
MPEKKQLGGAQRARSPSTQAGEYVREEIEHVRQGKHGARSAKQAMAIGLSKARRAGLRLPPPAAKKTPKATGRKPNPRRPQATLRVLKREGTAAASHTALSRRAHRSAEQRGSANRRRAAQKACARRVKRAGKMPRRRRPGPAHGTLLDRSRTGHTLRQLESVRSLEELHGALVLFRRLTSAKRAQIFALAALWIRFPGIEAIVAGLEFSDHTQGLEQLLRHRRF